MSRLQVAAVALVAVMLAGSVGAAWRERERRIAAEGAAQAAALQAQGFQQAARVAERNIGSQLVSLRNALAELKESGARPVVVVGGETDAVPVEAGAPEFDLSATTELIVGSTVDGELYATGAVEAHLVGLNWAKDIRLPVAEQRVEASKSVRDALRYWQNRPPRVSFRPRSPAQWRVGPVAGAGVCQSDRLDACIFVGIGVQF